MLGDGRSKKGANDGPKDGAARQRKSAALKFLREKALAFSSAAAILFLVLWQRERLLPRPAVLPPGAYATLADASHELAHRSCAEQQWAACLDQIDQTKRLDPKKIGPAEERARQAALAAIRQQALTACEQHDYVTCLAGLDKARGYDPDGDAVPLVQLARSEAQQKLHAAPARTTPLIPDAKEIPVPHR